jgi:hypothetical protein
LQRPNSPSQPPGGRRLKWADEDGGKLNVVQFFEKNAEPAKVCGALASSTMLIRCD